MIESFPRVEIPGVEVDPEVRSAIQFAKVEEAIHAAHVRKEQAGMVDAMIRTGYVPAHSKGKRKKPTAHVRRMRKLALRSQRKAVAA